MACIFVEGFDKYGSLNSNSNGVNAMLVAGDWTTSGGTNNQIVAGLSATGQAFQCNTAAVTIAQRTLATSYARLIGGVRFSSSLAGGSGQGVGFADTGTQQCSITVNQSTGTISLRTGAAGGTALATSSASVTANSIHYLEWDITFGLTGAYQVWLDGASLFSGIGATRVSGNSSANQFNLCAVVGGSQAFTYDDLYLFDTTGTINNAVLLTSPRVETTFPNADSAVQFAFGAAVLGSNTQRTTATAAPAANSLVLRPFTPSRSCTLQSISFVPGATSAPANYRPVIYGDSSGAAGTLLSTGSTVTGVTSGATTTMPLTTPQALVAGTQYWLGLMDDTAVLLQQTDGSNFSYRAAATFASGAPGSAPAMTAGQASFLIWGNITSTGVNWFEVSQQPPQGLSSYVFDATVGHEDLYNFPALSVPPTSIYAVAVKGNMQKSDAGAKTVSLRMKSGATDGAGSLAGQALGTSFQWLSSYFETDPNGGTPWTGVNLNAATSGFRVDS